MTQKTPQNSPVSGQSTYLNVPPRVMEIKTKTSKWDLNKVKSLCTAKEAINKIERQLTKWEKKFANYVTNKGLASKIYKQLIWFSITKKQLNYKWADE